MLTYEAEVGKELTHPNVIKIHTVGRDSKHNNIPFFTMEFFPAGSLKLRIQRKQLDCIVPNASSILKQSATAMAYINASGWVHRDIKPENMLINSSGTLKVIDFALAARVETETFWSRLFRRKRQVCPGNAHLHVPRADPGRTARRPLRHLQLRHHVLTKWPPCVRRSGPRRCGSCCPSSFRKCRPRRRSTTPT